MSFVNLDHRRDRLVHMEQELARVGISAVRMRGMLPEETIKSHHLDTTRLQVMQNRTPGAIGCHYAQVRIMQEALHQGKHAFVMEDDLIFCSDFKERMDYISRFLEGRKWDVIWLGGTFHVNPPWWHKDDLGRDAELTDDPRILRTFGAFSTHAYIVNSSSLEEILRRLEGLVPLSMGIDWAFIQMQPSLQTFAFVPGSIIQMDNQSDIGRGKTVFSGFRRLGPYWFADRMEDFDPMKFDWREARC